MNIILSLLLPAALAGSGDDVLAKVDAALNLATDTTSTMSAETVVPGKKPIKMEFQLQTRGQMRRVQFASPGDMKGTRVLVLSSRQMYVYLPAYNKIRRVASHASNQGFMGTMFSDADMSTTHFGSIYEAELKGETDAAWSLRLSPKEGEKTAYAAIEIDVSKENSLPATLRYFDSKGKHVKTESRSEYFCKEAVCQPGFFKMVDHTRGDAFTTLKQDMTGLNEGLAEDLFTQRALQQGW
jgi:outer membrane lipoprotein-sorting protein